MTRVQIAQQFTLLNYPIVLSALLTVAGLVGGLIGSASTNEDASYDIGFDTFENPDAKAFAPAEPIMAVRKKRRARLLSVSAFIYLAGVLLILLFAAFSTVGGVSRTNGAQWRFLWATVCFELVFLASFLVFVTVLLDLISVRR